MTEESKKIADFILSRFKNGYESKDDIHLAIDEKYNYDVAPFYVLEKLKDEGLIKDLGETYYMLSKDVEKAMMHGYNKQKRRQERLNLIKEYKEYITIVCTIISIISMVIAIVANLM